MARLSVAFCCSHAPALVQKKRDEIPGWDRLNKAYDQLASRLAAEAPDFLIVVYDDHLDNFFLNALPTFALGAAPEYGVADEGLGGYWHGKIPGHEKASLVLAEGLVAAGFDLTVCHGDMALDHGASIPVPRVSRDTPLAVVPLAVNCVWPPIPSAARCWELGRAIRRVLSEWDEDVTYGIVGTGGLSHQLDGAQFGRINQRFDQNILDIASGDRRRRLSELSEEELRRGGDGALEILNWTVAAAAAGDEAKAEVLAYEPLTSAVTGMAVLVYDLDDKETPHTRSG